MDNSELSVGFWDEEKSIIRNYPLFFNQITYFQRGKLKESAVKASRYPFLTKNTLPYCYNMSLHRNSRGEFLRMKEKRAEKIKSES